MQVSKLILILSSPLQAANKPLTTLEENYVHTCNAWQGRGGWWDAQTCPCSFQGLLCKSTISLWNSLTEGTKASKINIPV